MTTIGKPSKIFNKKAVSNGEMAFALGVLFGTIFYILIEDINVFNISCISGCIILLSIGSIERL